MNIEKLISQIQSLDGALKQEANRTVNRLLTIRNWMIGYYIVEYEQNGDDRAEYGSNILQSIAEKIGTEGFSQRNLKLFRQIFLAYANSLPHNKLNNFIQRIGQTVSAQFELEKNNVGIGQTSAQFELENNSKWQITFQGHDENCPIKMRSSNLLRMN